MGRPQARKKPEKTATMSETVSVNGKLVTNQINENANNINILLLGCTGVGKSTFINSFVNYLTHSVFDTALSEKLAILIPTKIRVTDRHGESLEIRVGAEDQNEHIQTGDAQTQRVKTYVFPIADKNVNIRLIDTPGMGDPRGIEQDDINCENILNYIGNLDQLHAICFLLKPNESRDTVLFKYCICQIFSRLDKSACNNIIFSFTHTRGTDYSPGETIDVLRKNIEEIRSKPPYATIPSNRNIFCFDNEGFRCLVGLKKNVDFDDSLVNRNMESWRKSVEECWKLFHYITGDEHNPAIKPHTVRSTNAVNEARRLINRLAKPLADVAQLIQDNLYVLDKHKNNLELDEKSLDEMKDQLYIPAISLEVHPLEHPTTVCTSRECADFIKVGEMTKWHYKQRCHEPCDLGGVVAKEIVGDPQLLGCLAIDSSTEPKETQEVDPNVQLNIINTTELVNNKKIVIKTLEQRQDELQQEYQFIIESSAKFAHFLQNNAITPFSDTYKQYIEYLIEREKSLGRNCNADTLNRLKTGLAEYVNMKNQFDKALQDARGLGHVDVINQQEVKNCFEGLCKMKHHGAKIKELYEVQEGKILKHQTHKEYVHDTPASFQNFLKGKEVNEKNNKESIEKIEEESCTCKHCAQHSKTSLNQNHCDAPAQQCRKEQHYETPDQPSPDKLKEDGNHASMPTKGLSENPDPNYNNACAPYFFPGFPYFPGNPYFPHLYPGNSYFPQLPPNTPFSQVRPGNPFIPQLYQGNGYFPQIPPQHLSFYPQAPLNYPYPNVFEDVYNPTRNSTSRQNPFNDYFFNSYQQNGSIERLDRHSMYQPRQTGNNTSNPMQDHPNPHDSYYNNAFAPNSRPGKPSYNQLSNYPGYYPNHYPNDDVYNRGNSIEKQNPYQGFYQDNYNHKENGLTKRTDQPSMNQPKQNGNNALDPIRDHLDPRELYLNNTSPPVSYPAKPYFPQFQADEPYFSQLHQEISTSYRQSHDYSPELKCIEDAYDLRRNFMAKQNSCESLYQDIRTFFNGDKENETAKRFDQLSMNPRLDPEDSSPKDPQTHSGHSSYPHFNEDDYIRRISGAKQNPYECTNQDKQTFFNGDKEKESTKRFDQPSMDTLLNLKHSSFKDPQTRPGGHSAYPHFNEDEYIRRISSANQNPYENSSQDNRTSFNGDKENESTKRSGQPFMNQYKQNGNNGTDPIQYPPNPRELHYNMEFPPKPYPGNLHLPPLHSSNSLPQLPMSNPSFSPSYSRHPSFNPLPFYPQRPPGIRSHPDFTKGYSTVKQNYNRGSYQDNRSSFNKNNKTKRFGSVKGNASDSSYQSADEEEFETSETMKDVSIISIPGLENTIRNIAGWIQAEQTPACKIKRERCRHEPMTPCLLAL